MAQTPKPARKIHIKFIQHASHVDFLTDRLVKNLLLPVIVLCLHLFSKHSNTTESTINKLQIDRQKNLSMALNNLLYISYERNDR